MRIAIVGVGTRGDMQPLAPLAHRLSLAGHSVRFIAHPSWAFLLEGTSAELVPLGGGDPRAAFATNLGRRPRTLVGRAVAIGTQSHAYEDKAQVLEHCRGADFILSSQLYWPAAHIAEYLGLPCAVANFTPHHASAEFPRPVGPVWLLRRRLGRHWNLLTHRWFEARVRKADLPWLNAWRRELGLAPIADPVRWADERRIPQFYGYSPVFLPKPRDWPPWHHVTGYWYWNERGWEPPPALVDFLAAGPAVFVGFSSSLVADADVWRTAILPGIRQAGCRAVIAEGWSDTGLAAGRDVHVVRELPFAWMFRRAAAVVHAAGAGVVGELLRAGRPSVTLPMYGDQKFNAARLEQLGVAPPPLRLASLTAGGVSRALRAMLERSTPAERAAALGARVAAEDGPGYVVREVEAAVA